MTQKGQEVSVKMLHDCKISDEVDTSENIFFQLFGILAVNQSWPKSERDRIETTTNKPLNFYIHPWFPR